MGLGGNESDKPLSLEELRKVWANVGGDINTDCNNEFNRIIFRQDSGPRKYNKRGFEQVLGDMEYLLSSYFNEDKNDPTGKGNHIISVPGAPGYDPFQDVIIDACGNPDYQNQGSCRLAAEMLCKSCTNEQVPANTALLRLCGCQVRSTNRKEVPPQCDPLCAQELISKNRNTDNGEVAECNDTVCVINNISINASRSTVGGISFTQVCPQCSGSDGCRCILDASIPSLAESIGIGNQESFQQVCGQNSICLIVDNETQETKEIPCQDAIKPIQAQKYHFPISPWVWIIAVIILVVAVLVIFSSIHIYSVSKTKPGIQAV